VERGLAAIERSARTQARLISDLLDASRIVSGKLRLAVTRIEVEEVIRSATEVVRQAADAKGVRLMIELDPNASALVADADRVQQVLWNLLANAIRFTPAHGTVIVSSALVDSHVRIAVADTGLGIAAEHLPFIFDRFRQVDGSTTRTHGGLGLGLAIVRHLVEAHGGTVSAHSAGQGTGTTFVVLFPIRAVYARGVQHRDSLPEGDREGSERPLPVEQPLLGRRVLVVDDDDDSLELLRVVLEDAGALCRVAKSAREALAAAARSHFDAVVSDIGMPETDGYAFMRALRASGSSIPAIALTAYARVEDADLALECGYQAHVAKPVNADELLAWLARLLGSTDAPQARPSTFT
jgi:CheY-like chemotaxis protein